MEELTESQIHRRRWIRNHKHSRLTNKRANQSKLVKTGPGRWQVTSPDGNVHDVYMNGKDNLICDCIRRDEAKNGLCSHKVAVIKSINPKWLLVRRHV